MHTTIRMHMVSTPQVYMLPLGGGVSKAGGNHKWSNGESRAQPPSNPSHARRGLPTRPPI